jgi:Tfp pilus assembly protein PilF
LTRRRQDRRAVPPFGRFALVLGAAFALTFASFAPSLHAEFVSDDVNAIVQNQWVSDAFDPAGIFRSASWWGEGRADAAGYRPAATLLFALERMAFDLDPSAFRMTNFALHALCVALLFTLAEALGLATAAAACAALLFAVLPIHSEAVIWIVGRAELGAAIGFLGTALLCLHYRRSGRLSLLPFAAATVAAGMFFKENAVTVLAVPPLYALLLDPCDPSRRRDAQALSALALGVAIYAAIRLSGPGAGFDQGEISVLDNPLAPLETGTRLLGAIAVFGRYIALTLWPHALSVDYSFDALGIGPGFLANGDTAVALSFLATAIWCALRGPGPRHLTTLGLLLAGAAYSIVSNTAFVLGTILGERLFYLPTAGLCLAAAAALEPVLIARDGRRVAAMVLIGVLVATFIAIDQHRAGQWRTPIMLFESAVRALPRSARAHMELASAYGREGDLEAATSHFETALEIKPDYSVAAYNYGNTLVRAGRFDEAVEAYRKAIDIDPRFGRAWHNLALAYRLLGRAHEWAEALGQAAATSPGAPELLADWGEALLAAGRDLEALQAYDQAIAAGIETAEVYFNRGVARHRMGGCDAALDDYRRAAAIPGAPPQTSQAVAGCLRELGATGAGDAP